jgi:hypothetical protein
MKSLIVFVLIVSFSLFCTVTFETTFGNEWDDYANSVIQTSDGGYIFTGSKIDSTDYKLSYFTIIKTNSFGEKEWENTFSGITASSTDNAGHSVVETFDGGYVVTGCREDLYHTIHADLYVIKIDSLGNKIWDYRYGFDSSVSSYGYDIIQTSDGGFAISGENFGSMLIVKLDHEGNEVWTNDFFKSGKCRSIIQTEDKGFAIAGFDEDGLILLKTDSLGNNEWEKNFGGFISVGTSVKKTLDNGFVILGLAPQLNYGTLAWLIKTDENGEIEWDLKYGNVGSIGDGFIGSSIDLTEDSCYVLTGYTDGWLGSLSDPWLIKVDSEGNIIWEQRFEGDGDERAHYVYQADDGGYILAGYTDSQGAGGKDMWIIKTNETGTEIESPFFPQTTELHQNYPNPFNPVTEIKFELQNRENVNLAVFNSKGELVRTLYEGKKDNGIHTVSFDASGLNSGIYFYKLTAEDNIITRKMLFLK